MPKPLNVSAATWAEAKNTYINSSLSLGDISDLFGIPVKVTEKWATKGKWAEARQNKGKAPPVEVVEERKITLVSPEAISDLPASIRELHEQCDLLATKSGGVGKVPFEKWDKMLAMKLGQIAVKMLNHLDSLPPEDLLDAETIRGLKVLADIKETLRPPDTAATTSRGTGSILNVHLMNGIVPDPIEKKADAIEVGS